MLLYVLFAMYFLVFIKDRFNNKRKNQLKEAFELISKGFANATIEDTKDIQLIYKRCIANHFEELSFADFLERYIIELHKSELESSSLNSIKNNIKAIIEEERCEKPFDGVNDHERRLLSAIEDGAKRSELSSISHNLDELAIVLKGNQKRLRNALVTNRWTVPISIIGVILTIAIWIFGSTSISSKDMDKINDSIRVNVNKAISQPDSLKITQ